MTKPTRINPAPQTLEEREERDKVAEEGAAAAARVSEEVGASEGGRGSRLRPAVPLSRRRAKGGRSLARATGETGSWMKAHASISRT